MGTGQTPGGHRSKAAQPAPSPAAGLEHKAAAREQPHYEVHHMSIRQHPEELQGQPTVPHSTIRRDQTNQDSASCLPRPQNSCQCPVSAEQPGPRLIVLNGRQAREVAGDQ